MACRPSPGELLKNIIDHIFVSTAARLCTNLGFETFSKRGRRSWVKLWPSRYRTSVKLKRNFCQTFSQLPPKLAKVYEKFRSNLAECILSFAYTLPKFYVTSTTKFGEASRPKFGRNLNLHRNLPQVLPKFYFLHHFYEGQKNIFLSQIQFNFGVKK